MSLTQHQRSPPFIIWTLRRTGGTNLAQALFERSPHMAVQHEPFNQDRIFGQVTRDWLAQRDEQALGRALREVCARQVLIKHCVETLPNELNTALAEISRQAGYRHVFLYRRHSLGRLLSLHFAQVSGVWGKPQAEKVALDDGIYREPIPTEKLLQHEKKCRLELQRIFKLLLTHGETPNIVVFEDIFFSSEPQAAAVLLRVLKSLNLARSEEDQQLIDRLLKTGSQGTRSRYQDFVNYSEFAEQLRALGDFDLRLDPKDAITAYLEPLPPSIQHAILWETEFDPFSSTYDVAGVVVISADTPTRGELFLQTGDVISPVVWEMPSPRMQQQFPDNPHAQRSRFQSRGLSLSSGESAQIIWRNGSGKQFVIARLEAKPFSYKGKAQTSN